jgi:molybdate transport system ATP-binding protein
MPLDFALRVAPGRTVALVGPSGGGKTTALRCIAGLHRPETGHIRYGGEAWFDSAAGINRPARDRRVGFVFQSYALFPHRTALANMMEAMLDVPLPERRERAEGLLQQMQLDGLGARRPAQLSGGQQQRVALARALARQPDVLLLDEPFSAVDHPTRRLLHRSLQALRESSAIPIVLVTHDIEDAARVADDLCFVQAGRVVESGPVASLLGNAESALARWMAS